MSSEIKIRFAKKSDLEFLNSNVYISGEILLRKIELQEIIITEKNGVQAGFLQLEYLWSLVPYIALIKVLPEYQRQGIGKKMLEFTESFLREKKYKKLYSSSQANEPNPQEWHRHVGFEECGIITGINEEIGEIFFCKNLQIEQTTTV